jgi:predicted nucleic acid-binding protein
MNLAVDASVLIAELLRVRGRALFQRADLRILVSQEQWAETAHGLEQRAALLRRRVPAEEVDTLIDEAHALVATGAIIVVPSGVYAERETAARRRVRDQSDWPTVALALATDSAILTNDPDFLGSGIATWTVDTLLAELESREHR